MAHGYISSIPQEYKTIKLGRWSLGFVLNTPCYDLKRSVQTCAVTSNHRVLLVPDRGKGPGREKNVQWAQWVQDRIPRSLGNMVFMEEMPDPYESNSKRWEREWLSVLREVVRNCDEVTFVGWGTGAVACMRYLEMHQISGGAALALLDGDEYFASERHGRAYCWEDIRKNAGRGGIALGLSPISASERENKIVTQMLAPHFLWKIPASLRWTVGEREAPGILEMLLAIHKKLCEEDVTIH